MALRFLWEALGPWETRAMEKLRYGVAPPSPLTAEPLLPVNVEDSSPGYTLFTKVRKSWMSCDERHLKITSGMAQKGREINPRRRMWASEESQPLRGGQLKASTAARPWTLGTRGQAGAPVTSDSHGESQLVTCLIKPGPPEEPVLQVGLRPGQGWRRLSPGHVAS